MDRIFKPGEVIQNNRDETIDGIVVAMNSGFIFKGKYVATKYEDGCSLVITENYIAWVYSSYWNLVK